MIKFKRKQIWKNWCTYFAALVVLLLQTSCVKTENKSGQFSDRSRQQKQAQTQTDKLVTPINFHNPKNFSFLYEKNGKPKTSIKIGVIDSGYGGLSVTADIGKKMSEFKAFQKVELVFYNAFFSRDFGYGDLDRPTRAKVLSKVFEAMAEKEKPDVIFLACNSLSVFYYETDYSKDPKVPVIEIVEPATNLLADTLKEKPNTVALIFSTPVTASYKAYPVNLKALGVDSNRIIPVPCGKLAPAIEGGMDETVTRKVIAQCLSQAMDRARRAGVREKEFLVSFNCTHYNYAKPIFEKVLNNPSNGITVTAILNPNTVMSDPIFIEKFRNRNSEPPKFSVQIKSPLEMGNRVLNGLGKLVANEFQPLALAMANPTIDDDLYNWESVVQDFANN